MAAGHEFPLFGRRGVTNKRQQIRLNAGIIEQRIPLRGCAIGCYRPAGALLFDKESEEVILHSVGRGLEPSINRKGSQAAPRFFGEQRADRGRGLRTCANMAPVELPPWVRSSSTSQMRNPAASKICATVYKDR